MLQLITMRLTVIYQQFLSKIRNKRETEKKKIFSVSFFISMYTTKGLVDIFGFSFFSQNKGLKKGGKWFTMVLSGRKW